MVVFKYSFLLLFLYACGNTGSSTPAKSVDSPAAYQVDTPQKKMLPDSSVLSVQKNAVLTIDLKAAAATGFSWVIKDSTYKEKLTYVGQSFINASGDKDGTDGVQQFRFKPNAVGEVKLSFVYVQPFNKPFPKDATAKTFSVVIIP